MASAHPLSQPLVDDQSGNHSSEPLVSGVSTGQTTWWRRSATKTSLVIAAVAFIGLACLFVLAAPGKEVASSESLTAKPTSVQEVLEMFPNLINVKDCHEFFERLPAHEQEDAVFQHVTSHSQFLFSDFLENYGSSAPQWKTGEKLSLRQTLEDAEEFKHRLSVFETNLREIIRLNNVEATHNSDPDRAVFSINEFADWTWTEFKTLLGGPLEVENTTDVKDEEQSVPKPEDLSVSPPCGRNWVRHHASVYTVRQQGSCGSCYAHAVVETLRAVAFINSGIDPGKLSVQYAMDCTGDGCNGGDPGAVINKIASYHGIPTRADYGAYQARGQRCHKGIRKTVSTSGSQIFHAEPQTAAKLCHAGPLTVAISANSAFMHYHSGILSKASCPAQQVNHAVQLVGVGKIGTHGNGAWLIRNSWGTSWGISPITYQPSGSRGYIRLRYGYNTCNIRREIVWPAGVQLLRHSANSTGALDEMRMV
jgi:C1A family cysteine protease